MPNANERIDVVGQAEFLNAVDEIAWKDRIGPLVALERDVLPQYVRLASAIGRGLQGRYRQAAIESELDLVLSALIESKRPEAADALAALRHWAEQYAFKDRWLLDAGHQTARAWLRVGSDHSRWYPALLRALFPTPRFDAWTFPNEDWAEHYRKNRAAFESAERAHRAEILAIFKAQGRPSLKVHARWTALYMSGRSSGEIAVAERNPKRAVSKKGKVSKDSVYQAISAFAASIELTLPKR